MAKDETEAKTVREYRTAELAGEAGIPVRTLRFYRERKLLPPPRREGRIAWYDDHHLARLRTIAALLERGHTLGGIAELTTAFESGRDVGQLGELLGIGWSEETPVRLSPEALADYFEGEVTPENLAASLDLGYLATDGEEIVHVSRRLLDVSSALVREGVPLAAVLETGRRVRAHADALAALFTELISAHIAQDDAVTRLRPLAKSVVEAELTMAMDRLLAAAPAPDDPAAGTPASGAPATGPDQTPSS
ncbi:MerR family transcriptional regulator [Streptomyces subrutilus]|uniref:MerR family transcriptional regulator n=1 Tax=Streptomyces subrutilus TaxID=36818 RepID=A0A5P2UPL2_9ACTN|nr:MerR family transcriptional regulator [Streptomyces subrutilus]QEU80245.1 MerR family transcriptional regulator [Streptomyces subrutilus]WSJ30471.1 MerR family transcriptional regulator [Streptomyces subrutilus]GGZ49303.1 MerR family transcriptional regulator [Streptomyces subrutilus]